VEAERKLPQTNGMTFAIVVVCSFPLPLIARWKPVANHTSQAPFFILAVNDSCTHVHAHARRRCSGVCKCRSSKKKRVCGVREKPVATLFFFVCLYMCGGGGGGSTQQADGYAFTFFPFSVAFFPHFSPLFSSRPQ
jgi:hypothetical protein